MNPDQAPEAVPYSQLEVHSQYVKNSTVYESGVVQTPQYSSLLPPHQAPKKRIMGLHRSTFWLLIVLIIVIIAAAVGGGIGGSLAVERAKSNNNGENDSSEQTASTKSSDSTRTSSSEATGTSSSEATSTGVLVVPSAATLPFECEEDGDKKTVEWWDKESTFTLTCDSDYSGADLVQVRVYSLRDCAIACVEINVGLPGECVGFVYDTNLTAGRNNCFVKKEMTRANSSKGVIAAQID